MNFVVSHHWIWCLHVKRRRGVYELTDSRNYLTRLRFRMPHIYRVPASEDGVGSAAAHQFCVIYSNCEDCLGSSLMIAAKR
eukprot:scaffold327595_cov33-Prasinocladus_malaysianus.AAC.1